MALGRFREFIFWLNYFWGSSIFYEVLWAGIISHKIEIYLTIIDGDNKLHLSQKININH